MKVTEYVVKRGDTLGLIAHKYTGNKDRWPELFDSNPHIPRYRDGYGTKRFAKGQIQVGQIIYLPYGWAVEASQRGGMVSGPGEMGTVGGNCSPGSVPHYPGVLYIVHDGMMPAAVAADDFGQVAAGGWGDYSKLSGANVNYWSKGFTMVGSACVPAGWKDGIALRVPKAWLDIPTPQLSQLPALSHLVLESDGTTPWVPPTGTGPGPGPGAVTCPEGQMPDPTGTFCVDKGTGKKVAVTDEGIKGSTILLLLLAAGAGIGGALLLNNLIKSRKVYGPPPAPSAAPRGEIVVRR